jgi:hypothetical protein
VVGIKEELEEEEEGTEEEEELEEEELMFSVATVNSISGLDEVAERLSGELAGFLVLHHSLPLPYCLIQEKIA